jgi:DNA-binding winged helix-turn-helix (wHTH) protein
VKSIFLFSFSPDDSPMRRTIAYGRYALEVYEIENNRFFCPIGVPPQLVVLEVEPHTPVSPLITAISNHAVVGRVPLLIVLDPEWLSMAPRLLCNDFISRGFTETEALARIDRLLGAVDPLAIPRLTYGPLVVDLDGFEARIEGNALQLTPQEFALLRHLALHPGRAMSREVLLQRVWGQNYFGGTRTVDIHVRRLRAKLGADVSRHLQTVRHIGYKWSVNPGTSAPSIR